MLLSALPKKVPLSNEPTNAEFTEVNRLLYPRTSQRLKYASAYGEMSSREASSWVTMYAATEPVSPTIVYRTS